MKYPIIEDTPETNDHVKIINQWDHISCIDVRSPYVRVDFARKLERERDAYKRVLIGIAGFPSVLWDVGTTIEFSQAAKKVLEEYEKNKTTT